MSRPMDPISGAYSMFAEDRSPIPSWEKGSKLPHWDSSDLSGISSSSGEEDNSSFELSFSRGDGSSAVVDSDDEAGPPQFAISGANNEEVRESTERTPRAAKKHLHGPSMSSPKMKKIGSDSKGKGKAKDQDQDEDLSQQLIQSVSASGSSYGRQQHTSASISGGRTRTRRPRSHSNASTTVSSPPFASFASPPASAASADGAFRITSRRAPGPAAQAMADFMSTSRESSSSPQNSSLSVDKLMPSSSLAPVSSSSSKLGSRPLSRPLHLVNSNRSLGRAISAPNNLFAESAPTNNLFSPGGSGLARAGLINENLTPSSSPEAEMQTMLNRAYEARSGSIDFSHKNLARIAANVADLSHYVTWDARTRSSRPTPIYLNFDNNYLNAAGLPPSLFTITNLEILSLRANQIESLPQSIGNLTGLKQLLLFNNKLTYLPAEILDLKLEKLVLGSNRFPPYVKPEAKLEQEKVSQSTAQDAEKECKTPKMRVCERRKLQFKVPSLVELCTRRLLEPIDASRESGSPAVSTKSKLFTPGMTNASGGSIRRNFHTVKDSIDYAAVPRHLLQPFLSLLHPLPPHLRCLLTPSQSPSATSSMTTVLPGTPSTTVNGQSRTPGTPSLANLSISTPLEATKDIPQCSKCKTPCSQFAEHRVEWRSEIAGVQLGKADDERCWVPVLWRGCSANCLDFLDEPLE